jgi:3'-5' exoribonuclease
MRRLYLADCAPGDLVDDVYVLSGKQFAAGSNGKHYIKAFVSDRSCQVTARMWNATREIFSNMPEAGFVRLRGRIENYQNNLQCIIEQVWPAKDGTFEIGDLLPQTKKDIEQMCRRLGEVMQSIQNRHLAALVQAYLDDEKLMADFCRAPAAMSFHHAFIGGLLEHTLNAVEVADAVVKFYPGLNRDLVIAGIFLHDIAKTWELCYDCAFGYTDGGQLVGHIVKSAMWVEHKAREAEAILGGEKVPQPLIDVLQHIIISHHGVPEFGAIKQPCTPEAIAVHMIENMDAKLTMSLLATRGAEKPAGTEGNWTEYMKAFGGRLFRPDVAPAEAPADGGDEPTNGEAAALAPAAPAAPTAGNAAPGADAGAPGPRLVISNPLFEAVPSKRK